MKQPLAELRQVTKEYRRPAANPFKPQTVVALNRVDLRVGGGEAIGVVGASGAGKSTLARLLVGLIEPTSGEIFFAGREAAGRRMIRELAGRRQIVFQNPYRSLSPRLTVEQIIDEPAALVGLDADISGLLELVSLSRRLLSRYPHQLSAGERQRVAIARALSTRPELLVLDEPTSALDPIAGAAIIRMIDELKSRQAVVIISHDPALLRAADRTLTLDNGQITAGRAKSAFRL
jgi:ABC-type glutathione transport system ATPase component